MILVKSFIALLISNPENVILYCPLPLHHGGGGLMGCGHALLWGATVVNKTKFSASNYWKDCAKYKCNVAQYIGEMCRYILSSCPEDNIKHPVKVMFGNGLKPNIWKVFQQKYKISQVFEWYACSEGNLCLLNLDNKVGSVGHIPPYLQKYSSLQLVRYSEESSEPIRNVDGFCMKVGENEPGLAIGAIAVNKRFEPLEYTGYVDAHETKKKILHDVFVKGDEYFNSGDVMSRDEIGYYYFVDRLGDTFRWKGENVSTNEVETVISNLIGFKDVMAYGVEIPGTEGRAGMISIVHDHTSMDMDFLLSSCKRNLPSYAIPIFVRFVKSSSLTSTYKLKKFNLKSEGFNINVVTDTIYICNPAVGKYEVLTPKLYSEINNGTIRL
ncbi:long-chain fatty acid transport protein 1-like [Photinus pyralis]|nr:long-chain fatty acid transport protein 1-like [Photinus pyralis]